MGGNMTDAKCLMCLMLLQMQNLRLHEMLCKAMKVVLEVKSED